jgi:hypothetical protein
MRKIAMAAKKTQTKKKASTYKGKSTEPGGGGNFQKCVDSGKSKALCATIGRKRYGKAKMTEFATKGKKRAAAKKKA